MTRDEVIKRLRTLQKTKVGESIPDFLLDENNRWGERLSELCGAAADFIEKGYCIGETHE